MSESSTAIRYTLAAVVCSVSIVSSASKADPKSIGSSNSYVLARQNPQVVASSVQSVGQQFAALAAAWHRETGMYSLAIDKIYHWAYLQTILLGPPVVPHVLQEMQARPADWTHALRALTQQDPAAACKDLRQSVDAWLAWGRTNHFI